MFVKTTERQCRLESVLTHVEQTIFTLTVLPFADCFGFHAVFIDSWSAGSNPSSSTSGVGLDFGLQSLHKLGSVGGGLHLPYTLDLPLRARESLYPAGVATYGGGCKCDPW